MRSPESEGRVHKPAHKPALTVKLGCVRLRLGRPRPFDTRVLESSAPPAEAPNLLSALVCPSVLVLYENEHTPRDSEWNRCLDQLRDLGETISELRVLVVTRGGGPSPLQRKRLAAVINGAPLRIAVVTTSVRVRFISSSVALFASRLKSFAWDDLAGAYVHLSFDRNERTLAKSTVQRMQERMG